MSKKINGVKWNKGSKAKARRRRVIERLGLQLKTGNTEQKPLTDSDIKRINIELEILNTRI